ncbi:MAG: type VI secretion system protein VasI [Glaciecola sp.]
MNKHSIMTALLLFPSVVAADEERFDKCHQMSTDNIRLMCYDKETEYSKTTDDPEEKEDVAQVEPKPATEPEGKHWRLSGERSALDSRKDVWLSVISDNTEGNSIGSPIRATLWLRCMENKTNVLISFDRYTTDNQNVRYKFDDESVEKQWMETIRGGDGIGIWSGSRAIPFIKKMYGKERMVVAYNTYSGPVEFTFNISGVRARIDTLAKECEWTP